VSSEDRAVLEALARSSSAAHRQVVQARALLLASEGVANEEIARQCDTTPDTVRRWRTKFVEDGVEGVGRIRPGRGRKPEYIGDEEAKIIAATLEAAEDETHWSARRLAKKVKASKSTVQRIWSRNALQPHLQKTFKYSNDPQLVEKVVDVVGLYLNPPEKALVLSIDEKSQIQALNRRNHSS
jgi:transposase